MINGPIPDEHLDPDFPDDFEDALIESEDTSTLERHIYQRPDFSPEMQKYMRQVVKHNARRATHFGKKAE